MHIVIYIYPDPSSVVPPASCLRPAVSCTLDPGSEVPPVSFLCPAVNCTLQATSPSRPTAAAGALVRRPALHPPPLPVTGPAGLISTLVCRRGRITCHPERCSLPLGARDVMEGAGDVRQGSVRLRPISRTGPPPPAAENARRDRWKGGRRW